MTEIVARFTPALAADLCKDSPNIGYVLDVWRKMDDYTVRLSITVYPPKR